MDMGYSLSKQCNRVWGVLEGEAEKDNPDLTLLAGNFTHSESKLNTQILLLIQSRFLFVQNRLKHKYFPARESFFLLLSDIISWTWNLDSPEDYLQLHRCLHFCGLSLHSQLWTVLPNQWYVIQGSCWQRGDLVLRMLGWGLQEFLFLPLDSCMVLVKFTSAISFFSASLSINWPFSAHIGSLLEKQ